MDHLRLKAVNVEIVYLRYVILDLEGEAFIHFGFSKKIKLVLKIFHQLVDEIFYFKVYVKILLNFLTLYNYE